MRISILLFVMLPALAAAGTINIPADHQTIQEGIDAASNGDTVLVQPGRYFENLVIDYKQIVLGSLCLLTSDTAYISQTVIDADYQGTAIEFLGPTAYTINGFTITNGSGTYGGGISNGGYATLSNMDIVNNSAVIGGGIYSSGGGELSLTNVTVRNNSATDRAGGIYAMMGAINGVDIRITNNHATGPGGGIYLHSGILNLKRSILSNNQATRGGAIFLNDASAAELSELEMAFNTAEKGGAIYAEISRSININGVTFTENAANNGAAIFIDFSTIAISNSILWDNSAKEIYQIYQNEFAEQWLTVSYSNINGGTAGIESRGERKVNWLEGNINLWPLFCNPEIGDFSLGINSPCVGTGKNGTNMGALDVGCDSVVAVNIATQWPAAYRLLLNYPNPFNPSTTTGFELPAASEVTLIVYDLTGREVTRLADGGYLAGYHQVVWDGRNASGGPLPSGIYIARLTKPGYSNSIKMLLLK